MVESWNAHVLLGSGGRMPGLTFFDVESHCSGKVLSLSPGQSVYAVDVSPDGGSLAVGTKDGYLYLLAGLNRVDPESEPQPTPWLQGASVLSVRFVDDRHLVASDVAGRCLLWNLLQGSRPAVLTMPGGGIVYALLRLDDRHLAGLSTRGRMIIWDWSRRAVIREVRIPPSAPILALIQPIFWSGANCWVWPACGGNLVRFGWPNCRCEYAEAHAGDFYGIAVVGADLFTVGRTDSCLKQWSSSLKEPIETEAVPRGLVSMAAWNGSDLGLVLTDETGRAGVYSRQAGTLVQTGWLPGTDFRIAASPDPVASRLRVRRNIENQARGLTMEIRGLYAKGHQKDADRLQGELERIGYKHIGLALQAEEARQRDDVAGELRAYTELVSLVPGDRVNLTVSLTRYAELLERVWLLEEAYALRQRLHGACASAAGSTEALARLSVYLEAMGSHECVIESAESLSTLIAGATALDKPFAGQYVMTAAGPSVRCYGLVPSADVLDRYEQVQNAAHAGFLPAAKQVDLAWLSGSGVERAEAVVLVLDSSQPEACLEYCLRIRSAGGQTIFSPSVLVRAKNQVMGTAVVERNTQISEFLRHASQGDLLRTIVHGVHECLQRVIARILTRQLAAKTYERGNEYV